MENPEEDDNDKEKKKKQAAEFSGVVQHFHWKDKHWRFP